MRDRTWQRCLSCGLGSAGARSGRIRRRCPRCRGPLAPVELTPQAWFRPDVSCALLDERGAVVAASPAWRSFARRNGGVRSRTDVGASYLLECERAAQDGNLEAGLAHAGLSRLLDGLEAPVGLRYPCAPPGGSGTMRLVATGVHPDLPWARLEVRHYPEAAATDEAHRCRLERLSPVEGEARRWSRELHDGPLQRLGALRATVDHATRADELPSRADELLTGLQETIDELRALISGHLPPALAALGLERGIEDLADRAAGRSGLRVDTRLDLRARSLPPLRRDLELALYRLVQEGLTNVLRHAGAHSIRVEVARDPSFVVASVSDDGTGAAGPPGTGLTGLHERVTLLGGTFSALRSPSGTTLLAIVPA